MCSLPVISGDRAAKVKDAPLPHVRHFPQWQAWSSRFSAVSSDTALHRH